MPKQDQTLSNDELAFFDRLATLTRDPDAGFDELRTLYDTDARLHVPDQVYNATLDRVDDVGHDVATAHASAAR